MTYFKMYLYTYVTHKIKLFISFIRVYPSETEQKANRNGGKRTPPLMSF